MDALLDGRVALVTGAANGLGRAIAETFARHGARGVCFDLAASRVPGGWHAVEGDVTDEESVRRAVDDATETFGKLDLVVANAGVVPPWQAFEELDLDELDRVLSVNVRGVAATLKAAVPALRTQGGSVVAMASLNARRGAAAQGAYTASKHAVLGLVRAAALELGRDGIRVNALGPGPVATDALRERMAARARAGGPAVGDALAAAAGETALGRMATTDDVANAALFLASDLAAGVTGVLLPVDAGLV